MAKTAQGLVEYCKAQLGRPYWWSAFGQLSTKELYERLKAQYPAEYWQDNYLQQLGQRVHDCVGLIKGYLWSATPNSNPVYNAAQDVSVGGLYAVCDRKGAITGMPDIPGICVFYGNMGHVGVYIGNGEVIEAKGHAWGVIKSQLKGRGWAYWGMPRWIDYAASDNNVAGKDNNVPTSQPATGHTYTIEVPLLKLGATGNWVKTLQQLLIAKGYSCGEDGADGEFGMMTYQAVKAAQRALNIGVDGEVGGETWQALLKR